MAKTKVEYWFDPFEGLEIKGSKKKEALQEAADLLLESILSDVADGRSPVTGRKFIQLNKYYAKKEHGGDRSAKLELTGDLLGSLIVKVKKKDGVEGIYITVPDNEQGKADGHNDFSGESKLPKRQFIPNADEAQSFRPEIRKEIISIGSDFEDDTDV